MRISISTLYGNRNNIPQSTNHHDVKFCMEISHEGKEKKKKKKKKQEHYIAPSICGCTEYAEYMHACSGRRG